MIFAIAGVIAFTTWLVLGVSAIETLPRAVVTGAVFIGVGGTLLHYVLSCLKRHCRHGDEAGHSADHAFR